jgi:hypothetical protein
MHPADYKLYRIGVFDERDATIQNENPPTFLAHGMDFIEFAEELPVKNKGK